MSTQYRNQKLRHLFRVFDTDVDGVLTKADFLDLGDKLADAIGSAPAPLRDAAQAGQAALWAGLRERAEHAEGVTFADFLAWADAVEAPSLASWCERQFELLARGQGTIGIAEYAAWCHAFALPGDPDRMFRQLDHAGAEAIDGPEFLRLHLEFLRSDDVDAPGNVVWGQV